jgi:hypothetical protein
MVDINDIKKSLENKSTPELLRIWYQHNRNEYTDEAFKAIRDILIKRGQEILAPSKFTISESEPMTLNADDIKNMETKELLKIWYTNDRYEYADDTFRKIKSILEERNQDFLPQTSTISGKKRKLGKGYLWWFVILIFIFFYKKDTTIFSPNPTSVILNVLGVLLPLALCIFFFYSSNTKKNINESVLSNILFGLGTVLIFGLFNAYANSLEGEKLRVFLRSTEVSSSEFVTGLIIVTVMIVFSYRIRFKK